MANADSVAEHCARTIKRGVETSNQPLSAAWSAIDAGTGFASRDELRAGVMLLPGCAELREESTDALYAALDGIAVGYITATDFARVLLPATLSARGAAPVLVPTAEAPLLPAPPLPAAAYAPLPPSMRRGAAQAARAAAAMGLSRPRPEAAMQTLASSNDPGMAAFGAARLLQASARSEAADAILEADDKIAEAFEALKNGDASFANHLGELHALARRADLDDADAAAMMAPPTAPSSARRNTYWGTYTPSEAEMVALLRSTRPAPQPKRSASPRHAGAPALAAPALAAAGSPHRSPGRRSPRVAGAPTSPAPPTPARDRLRSDRSSPSTRRGTFFGMYSPAQAESLLAQNAAAKEAQRKSALDVVLAQARAGAPTPPAEQPPIASPGFGSWERLGRMDPVAPKALPPTPPHDESPPTSTTATESRRAFSNEVLQRLAQLDAHAAPRWPVIRLSALAAQKSELRAELRAERARCVELCAEAAALRDEAARERRSIAVLGAEDATTAAQMPKLAIDEAYARRALAVVTEHAAGIVAANATLQRDVMAPADGRYMPSVAPIWLGYIRECMVHEAEIQMTAARVEHRASEAELRTRAADAQRVADAAAAAALDDEVDALRAALDALQPSPLPTTTPTKQAQGGVPAESPNPSSPSRSPPARPDARRGSPELAAGRVDGVGCGAGTASASSEEGGDRAAADWTATCSTCSVAGDATARTCGCAHASGEACAAPTATAAAASGERRAPSTAERTTGERFGIACCPAEAVAARAAAAPTVAARAAAALAFGATTGDAATARAAAAPASARSSEERTASDASDAARAAADATARFVSVPLQSALTRSLRWRALRAHTGSNSCARDPPPPRSPCILPPPSLPLARAQAWERRVERHNSLARMFFYRATFRPTCRPSELSGTR